MAEYIQHSLDEKNRQKENSPDDIQGLSCAVFGSWGIGKSHFINGVVEKLENQLRGQKKLIYCECELWSCRSADELWNHITEKMNSVLGNPNWRLPQWLNVLEKCGGAFSASSAVWKVVMGDRDEKKARDVISEQLQKQHQIMVLVLDDVARASCEVVDDLLVIIQRLRKIQNLVIISAIARDELFEKYRVQGYSEKHLFGYLGKLFDHVTNLSLPTPEANRYHFRQKIASHQLLHSFAVEVPLLFDTPRQAEKVAFHLESIENQYMGRIIDSDRIADKKYTYGEITNCYLIFCAEIIRVFFPEIVRSAKLINPQESWMYTLSTTNEKNKNAYPEEALTSELLKSTMRYISECNTYINKEELSDISEMRYTFIYYLNTTDIHLLLQDSASQPESLLYDLIASRYEEQISKGVLPISYKSFFKAYVYTMPKKEEQLTYLKLVQRELRQSVTTPDKALLPTFFVAPILLSIIEACINTNKVWTTLKIIIHLQQCISVDRLTDICKELCELFEKAQPNSGNQLKLQLIASFIYISAVRLGREITATFYDDLWSMRMEVLKNCILEFNNYNPSEIVEKGIKRGVTIATRNWNHEQWNEVLNRACVFKDDYNEKEHKNEIANIIAKRISELVKERENQTNSTTGS